MTRRGQKTDAQQRIEEAMASAAETEAVRQRRAAEREERKLAWHEAHDSELERRRQARAAEREERKLANANERARRVWSQSDVQHALMIARGMAKRGQAPFAGKDIDAMDPIEVTELFHDWQTKRQEEMRNTPSLSEQMAKIIPIDRQTH